MKIVHNYRARRMQMDGDFHIFDLSDVEQSGEVRRTVRILLSQAYYVGTTAEPPATLPDNTESRQLAAALAPKDLEGVGVLTWRINDWTTWDQVWAYLPTIRRVRRVRSSTRGDRIPGFEVQGDDADCYDNKASYFAWKLIRADEVIGPLGSDTPYTRTLTDEPPSRRVMTLPYNAAVYDAGCERRRGGFRSQRLRQATGVDRRGHAARSLLRGRARIVLTSIATSTTATTALVQQGRRAVPHQLAARRGALRRRRSGAPTALLMLGVNEKENRGTPAGRPHTGRPTTALSPDGWFTTAHLDELSSAISGTPSRKARNARPRRRRARDRLRSDRMGGLRGHRFAVPRVARLAGADPVPGVAIRGELAGVRAARIGQVERLAADRPPRNHEGLGQIERLTGDERDAGEEVAVAVTHLAAVVKN